MSLPMNAPNEAGFYWARERGTNWWNYIVRVTGEAPYLKIDFVWKRAENSFAEPYRVFAFGPKIEIPPDPVLFDKENS